MSFKILYVKINSPLKVHSHFSEMASFYPSYGMPPLLNAGREFVRRPPRLEGVDERPECSPADGSAPFRLISVPLKGPLI